MFPSLNIDIFYSIVNLNFSLLNHILYESNAYLIYCGVQQQSDNERNVET